MTKLLLPLAVSWFAFSASAETVGTKLTYPRAQLVEENADSVPGIVEKFLADTGRTSLVSPDQVLFLLDGKPTPDIAATLGKADRVEVLSDGASVVINVVTRPAKPGT